MKKFFGFLWFAFLGILLAACDTEINNLELLKESFEKLDVPNVKVEFILDVETDEGKSSDTFTAYYDFVDSKTGLIKLVVDGEEEIIEVSDGVYAGYDKNVDKLQDIQFIDNLAASDIKVHNKSGDSITFEIISNVASELLDEIAGSQKGYLNVSEEEFREVLETLKVFVTVNLNEKLITKIVYNATDFFQFIAEHSIFNIKEIKHYEMTMEFSDYNQVKLAGE